MSANMKSSFFGTVVIESLIKLSSTLASSFADAPPTAAGAAVASFFIMRKTGCWLTFFDDVEEDEDVDEDDKRDDLTLCADSVMETEAAASLLSRPPPRLFERE